MNLELLLCNSNAFTHQSGKNSDTSSHVWIHINKFRYPRVYMVILCMSSQTPWIPMIISYMNSYLYDMSSYVYEFLHIEMKFNEFMYDINMNSYMIFSWFFSSSCPPLAPMACWQHSNQVPGQPAPITNCPFVATNGPNTIHLANNAFMIASHTSDPKASVAAGRPIVSLPW